MNTRLVPSLSWVVLVLALAVGCSESNQGGEGKIDEDAGVEDSGTDAGSDEDGGATDGSSPDANDDSGSNGGDADVDAGVTDADVDAGASTDGGAPTDSGMMGTDAGIRTPVCEPGQACGPGDACGDGETCIVNACGLKVCQARAAFCVSSAECAAGSACVTTAIGDLCTPSNGEVCNASTDCPVSHTCEGASGSRSCVERRIPCFDEGDCPISYACLGVTGDSASCQYAYRPCDSVGTCALSVCSDIDEDGDTECGAGGICESNSECSGDDRCMNLAFMVECGLGGLCNQSGGAACATGYECLDLRGDGYGECVPQGGSCDSSLDCANGGVCAVPLDRSPPRCFYPM